MIRCDLCGREKNEKEIYAYYPEDSTFICKECFDKNKEEKE